MASVTDAALDRLARRTDREYVIPALQHQLTRTALAHRSEMRIAGRHFYSDADPSPAPAARGFAWSDEGMVAFFGDLIPEIGQRWRVLSNAGGDAWLDDLLRDLP